MFEIWLITAIFVILYVYNKNRELYKAGNKFPGPRALPFLGNSLDFAANSNGIFRKVEEFRRKYNRFFRVWNNGKLYVICYEHQDAEVLLSSNAELKKTDLYKFFEPWIGKGLVSASDIATWRTHRKIITPTFHFKILQDFLSVFNRNATILCEQLIAKAGHGPFDVGKLIELLALDNICETAMGVNVNAQRNSESEYVKAVREITNIVALRCFKVWLMNDFLFKLSRYSKIQENCLKTLHGITNRVIRERRQKLRELKLKSDKNSEEIFCTKQKRAFLDLLLESEEGFKLSDRELREEVDTFMFALARTQYLSGVAFQLEFPWLRMVKDSCSWRVAGKLSFGEGIFHILDSQGQDTVSSAMSFTTYCLASHEDIQEMAYREQVTIFGGSNRPSTFADINEMKYLERVLKEVLRLYPSAPIIGRELSEDLILPGNYKVPKGAALLINIYALHRNPKVWQDPEKFNPDNFLPDVIQSRNPYSYIPFSAGPRNCLGQKYAMLAMKATISSIIRRFKILLSENPNHSLNKAFEIVLSSTNGYFIKIESRN